MKKIIFVFIFLSVQLISCPTFAQSYLDSTSIWYESYGGTAPPVYNYFDFNKYYIDGDTSISGTTYYQLYCDQIDSTWDFFTGNFLAVNFYNHVYKGGLREDGSGRFYFFYPSQSAESLLFDFNLNTGSLLPDMVSNYGCNIPPSTVTTVDTFYLGAQAVKHFHLSGSAFGKSLYEGIGSSGGFIWSGSLCTAIESGGCLIAYKRGPDSLFINCGQGTTGIEGVVQEKLLNVFPNPSSGTFTIDLSTPSNDISVYIYNSIGEEVFGESMKATSQKTIELKVNSAGFYFIKVFAGREIYHRKLLLQIQ